MAHKPVNTAIAFGILIAVVVGSFYYVYAVASRGPWMGISSGGLLNPDIAQALGLDQDHGYLIIEIAPGSPADKAGLHGGGNKVVDIGGRPIPVDGDIIVSMDDRQISGRDDICDVIGQKQAGDSVSVEVSRAGSTHEANLVLEESPLGESSDC